MQNGTPVESNLAKLEKLPLYLPFDPTQQFHLYLEIQITYTFTLLVKLLYYQKAVDFQVYQEGTELTNIYGKAMEMCAAVRNWNTSLYIAMEWSPGCSVSEKKPSGEKCT